MMMGDFGPPWGSDLQRLEIKVCAFQHSVDITPFIPTHTALVFFLLHEVIEDGNLAYSSSLKVTVF